MKKLLSGVLTAATLFLISLGPLEAALTLSFPANPPGGRNVDPTFPSLSFELSIAQTYIGTPENIKNFTVKILQNIKDHTGVSPIVRIGGSTSDRFTYNSTFDQDEDAVSRFVGPAIFHAMQSISSQIGTKWVMTLNFGTGSLQSATEEAIEAVKTLGGSLFAFEIGNEPNAYIGRGYRPAAQWSVAEYITEYGQWTTAILEALKGNSSTNYSSQLFQAGTACCQWKASDFIEAGLFQDTGTQSISLSDHIYFGLPNGNVSLFSRLLNHTFIKEDLTNRVGDAIAKTISARKQFVIGETNSLFAGGQKGVTDIFGAALFTLNYMLLGASMGISRLQIHNAGGSKYNVIFYGHQPPGSPYPPNVARPPYYAFLAFGEAIGKERTRVSEIETGVYSISAYGLWEGKRAARFFLINHGVNDGTAATPLPYVINLEPPANAIGATLKRLTAPNTFEKLNITWVGQTMYNSPDGSLQGSRDIANASVTNGVLTVSLSPSSAVLVTFY